MSKRTYTPTYPAELRDRGVRLFREHRAEYRSDNAAYRAIAPKLGCSPDSLRAWYQRAERDAGDDRYFEPAQQFLGKVHRLDSHLSNIHEKVERTEWLDRTDVVDAADSLEHVLAAHIELVAHIAHELGRPL